jgi:hypothetical protein
MCEVYFKCFGILITNDARRTREFSQGGCGKSSIQQEEDSFNRKLELRLRKQLVKCYIWSTSLYVAESWILRKLDQNNWKVLKCDAGKG